MRVVDEMGNGGTTHSTMPLQLKLPYNLIIVVMGSEMTPSLDINRIYVVV